MNAYVLEGVNNLKFKSVGIPEITGNEVLVEVRAAGICGSDIPRIFVTGTYSFPTIPGHEFSGLVVKAADEQNNHWVGKRVGIFPLLPCMKCNNCRKGNYELCDNYNYLGSRCDGGFAEYVSVPAWNLIELPENISFEEAAMLEPASVALHSAKIAEVKKGDNVVIYGLGTVGLLIAQWVRFLGAKKVMLIGNYRGQKELANKLGFKHWHDTTSDSIKWIKEQTNGKGVDIAIDAVGANETISNAINSVNVKGKVILVGNPKSDIKLEKDCYWRILRRELTLLGSWNSHYSQYETSDWVEAVRAISNKKIILKDLITHKFTFDKLNDGLDVMRNKNIYSNKVMLIK